MTIAATIPETAQAAPLVIVGTGMAGYTLAREYRKLSPDSPLVMITADDGTSYAKPTLSNALAGNKHPDQIGLGDAGRMQAQLGITLLTHTRVTGIDAAQHQLQITTPHGEETLIYRQLVLAVGASAIRPAISGNAADQLRTANSLTEYRHFHEMLSSRPDRRVLIIGAGLIGCEFANDLQGSGYQVTVADLAQQPLGRLLPADVAARFQQAMEALGVRFRFGTSLTALDQATDGLRATLSDGQQIPCDVALSAIGLQPNLALAHALGIQTGRAIVVNRYLATSLEYVYALGDCAEVSGHWLPYVMPLMQQARALAQTLSGQPAQVHYPAMPVAVKTPAAPLVVLPPPPAVAVEWRTETTEDGLIAKAWHQDQLQGFVLLGTVAGKQRMALAKQVPDLLPA